MQVQHTHKTERYTKMPRISATVLLQLLVLAAYCNIVSGGLLPNGNFETSPKPSDLNGTKVMHPYGIPDWEISGLVDYIHRGTKQGLMPLVVPEGKFAVRLGNEASLKQRVGLKKGCFYALTFSFGRTCAREERLNVSASSLLITTTTNHSTTTTTNHHHHHHHHHNHIPPTDWGILPLQTMYTSAGFDSYAWGFKAVSDQVEIRLHNPAGTVGDDPACGPIIDTVAINVLRSPLSPTKDNLVKNGGFEEGPHTFPKSTRGVLIPPTIQDGHSPLPAWIIDSLKAVNYVDASHPYYSVPQGQRAVELVGGKEGALTQVIRTDNGTNYVLTFAYGDGNNGCVGPLAVEAFADGARVRFDYDSRGTGGFRRGVVRFTAGSMRTRIRFLSFNYIMKADGSLCGPVVDDVKVSVG